MRRAGSGCPTRSPFPPLPAADATKDIITNYDQPAEMTATGKIVKGKPHIPAVMPSKVTGAGVAGTPDAAAVAAGLGVLPAVAVIAAFHQDAAPVPRTGPLIALPAGVTLIALWTHLADFAGAGWGWLGLAGAG